MHGAVPRRVLITLLLDGKEMKTKNLDAAIETYGQSAQAASTKTNTMLGFGAVAAGSLFVAGQADADLVYSGVINSGFNVSTVNASSTNAISPPLVFSSTGGAPAFGIGGNNRGPANPVGSTDILWGVGAGYVGGVGGVLANGPAFPASAINLASSSVVGGGLSSFASLAWAAAGLGGPGGMVIDPFSVGDTGTNTGFMGFSFSGGAGTNYGWARIQITSAGGLPTSMTVVDWAYNDDGTAIHVGTIPAPGALALFGLAAGASGIRRRKRAA